MKKFLAVLLVVVMVVSMIPATVSAAACTVKTTYGTHSKAYCDLLGVKYTQFGEAVEGECGQDGYTMYKCACGEYFADDIVDMPEHEHAISAKPAVERREPTCTQEGQAAMYLCINCDELYPVYKAGDVKSTEADAPAGALEKTAHEWASPSGGKTDCTATVQKCKNCDAVNKDHIPNAEHDFVYVSTSAIKQDPTNCTPGVATFKCKNCKVTKNVPVDVTGHTVATTTRVPASGNCEAALKEHYKCELCGSKFLKQDDGSLKLATDADLISTTGHSYASTPSYTVKQTCTTYGVDYYFCINCGVPTTKNYKEPLGHTTYEEAVEHDAKQTDSSKKWITKVAATSCTDQTTYTWKCQKECLCNGTTKAKCNIEQTYKEPAKGHTEVDIHIPATVKVPVSYTITICTNKGCDAGRAVSKTVTYNNIQYTLSVDVKVVGGDVYEMTTADKKNYHPIKISNEVYAANLTKCGAHFYQLDDDAINKAADCTTKGYDVYFCHECNAKVVLDLPALGHDFSKKDNTTVAKDAAGQVLCGWDCDEEVYVLCANGCGTTQKFADGLGHEFKSTKDKEVKVANCQESAGKYFKCKHCDYVKITGEVKYEYTPYFDTLAAAQKAHKDGLTATNNVIAGDCTKIGHIEYECAKCNIKVWVKDETTGKHKAPQGTATYEKATCENGKGLAAYTCERCGTAVKAENEPLGHIWEKHEAVAPTCSKDGNIEYYTCSRKDCSCCYEKDSKNKLQPSKYTYDKTTDTYTKIALNGHILPKTGCNIQTTTVAAKCTTKGYTHEICKNGCGYERVYNVVAALGHIEGATTTTLPTCTVDGSIVVACNRTGCDKSGVAKKTTLPKLGHKNAAGETITSKCNDTVEDRVCVECNKQNGCANCADIELNEKTKKYEVKKMHKEVDKDFAATCTTPAYTLTTCEYGCGEINKVEYKGKANGHKFAWGEKAGLDYVDAKIFADKTEEFLLNPANGITAYTPATHKTSGSVTFKCADCNAKITMEVKKVGVGITMTMDNAVLPGANYKYNAGGDIIDISPVDGDVLAFYIDINAFETDVWGFNFDFVYNAKALNFLGYDFCADDVFGSYMVNNVVTDEKVYEDVNNDGVKELIKLTKGAEGTVKISAYTENGIDGTMTDAKITGVNRFITLFFQVEALYEVTDKGVATVEKAEDIVVEIKNISITNTKGEVAGYGNKLGTKIDTMMDTNDNGNFNITDVQNCVKIIKGEADYEYLPACDVNKDGVVNLTDLDLMNKYLVGSVDAFEIYKALSWKTPEGFVAA